MSASRRVYELRTTIFAVNVEKVKVLQLVLLALQNLLNHFFFFFDSPVELERFLLSSVPEYILAQRYHNLSFDFLQQL